MTSTEQDERAVVLAPSARDGPVTVSVLEKAGFHCTLARDVAEACRLLEEGAAALLVAQEALAPAAVQQLGAVLHRQEPWSDLPVIVFTGRQTPGARLPTVEALSALGNVTLLERPAEVVTVVSAVRAALRARHRQYAARDVLAEQRRMQEVLRESDQRKTEFLAMLSHELRNPLTPIRNSTYLLSRAPPDGEQAARARQIIERQTEHLTRLVDDLLDITRISHGKIQLQRSRIDAREVVRRTCEDHRTLFEARGVELRTQTSAPAWIDADPTRIAQVVGNLLQNAAKFTRAGGTVTVVVAPAGSFAEIRVRDDGVGIARDALPRLFSPFVQAEAGRSRGGLGLGLALVKGIVELHGGAVLARSEGTGRGAEIVVSLPLAPDPPARPGARARPGASRSLSVLIVDDNVDGAQTLADVLRLRGHRAEVAHDGSTGVRKARAMKPDVVLCDIGLPDVDGYSVARTLREDEALRTTRLIALSGYAQQEDRRRSQEAGFEVHLAKPPALEELMNAMLGE